MIVSPLRGLLLVPVLSCVLCAYLAFNDLAGKPQKRSCGEDHATNYKPDIHTRHGNRRTTIVTEFIDHATEAWSTWENAIDRGHPDAVDNPAHESLLHMLHALVEQQRIANLIALGTAERGPYRYLDAGRTELRSEDAFGAAAHLLGIEEAQS